VKLKQFEELRCLRFVSIRLPITYPRKYRNRIQQKNDDLPNNFGYRLKTMA